MILGMMQPSLALCPTNQYPHDSPACLACPAHTHATAPLSAHDCRCEPGFICMYYRQVHATVTLNSTLGDFQGDVNGVRTSLVSGVAAAAGVVPSQVHIHYVVIRLSHRRRLHNNYHGQLQVSLVVSGTSGEGTQGLRQHLTSLQTRNDKYEVQRRILVLAIPMRQKELLAAVSAMTVVAVEQNT
jgi:hypothetical protein